LVSSELFNLDGNEENLEDKGKEKAIDESEENKEKKDEGKEKAVEETFESKYKAGYMTKKFEEMFDKMAI
jgi:hypothetical protein